MFTQKRLTYSNAMKVKVTKYIMTSSREANKLFALKCATLKSFLEAERYLRTSLLYEKSPQFEDDNIKLEDIL